MKEWNRDLFDPKKAAMESDKDRSPKEGNNFGFAFNDNNFSDRVLTIEIMAEPSDAKCDGNGCCSLLDWASHRKRRCEDLKKDQGLMGLEHGRRLQKKGGFEVGRVEQVNVMNSDSASESD